MNEWDERSLEWELPPDAVIVEVGGFEGRWLHGMWTRYPGTYYVFEPQTWALARLHDRLRADGPVENRSIHLEPYGLGAQTEDVELGGWNTDAASILKTPQWYARNQWEGRNERGAARLVAVSEALTMPRIDVLCMNIEGYEFVLLPEMRRRGIIDRVRNLVVQFHEGYDVPVDEEGVRLMLGETHDVIWDYPALTAWKRRID